MPVPPALWADARRTLLVASLGVLAAVLAVASLAGFGIDYAAKAMVWWGVGTACVWRGLRSGAHPHARFGAANGITLLRLALAAPMAGLLGEPAWVAGTQAALPDVGAADPATTGLTPTTLAWCVVVLATVTALLDAIDGALARRSGLASDFGARFDMETDAAFTLLLSALVWQAGTVGAWVLAAGLMRYAFVAAAARWHWLAAPLPPSRRRQTVCVVQITSLIVCLGPIVPPALVTVLAAASLGALSLSFAIDVLALARRAKATTPSTPPLTSTPPTTPSPIHHPPQETRP